MLVCLASGFFADFSDTFPGIAAEFGACGCCGCLPVVLSVRFGFQTLALFKFLAECVERLLTRSGSEPHMFARQCSRGASLVLQSGRRRATGRQIITFDIGTLRRRHRRTSTDRNLFIKIFFLYK